MMPPSLFLRSALGIPIAGILIGCSSAAFSFAPDFPLNPKIAGTDGTPFAVKVVCTSYVVPELAELRAAKSRVEVPKRCAHLPWDDQKGALVPGLIQVPNDKWFYITEGEGGERFELAWKGEAYGPNWESHGKAVERISYELRDGLCIPKSTFSSARCRSGSTRSTDCVSRRRMGTVPGSGSRSYRRRRSRIDCLRMARRTNSALPSARA